MCWFIVSQKECSNRFIAEDQYNNLQVEFALSDPTLISFACQFGYMIFMDRECHLKFFIRLHKFHLQTSQLYEYSHMIFNAAAWTSSHLHDSQVSHTIFKCSCTIFKYHMVFRLIEAMFEHIHHQLMEWFIVSRQINTNTGGILIVSVAKTISLSIYVRRYRIITDNNDIDST